MPEGYDDSKDIGLQVSLPSIPTAKLTQFTDNIEQVVSLPGSPTTESFHMSTVSEAFNRSTADEKLVISTLSATGKRKVKLSRDNSGHILRRPIMQRSWLSSSQPILYKERELVDNYGNVLTTAPRTFQAKLKRHYGGSGMLNRRRKQSVGLPVTADDEGCMHINETALNYMVGGNELLDVRDMHYEYPSNEDWHSTSVSKKTSRELSGSREDLAHHVWDKYRNAMTGISGVGERGTSSIPVSRLDEFIVLASNTLEEDMIMEVGISLDKSAYTYIQYIGFYRSTVSESLTDLPQQL